MQILSELLTTWNDGRKKTLFCVAVNLMELSELEEAMAALQDRAADLPAAERGAYAQKVLCGIADRRGLELKLRRKRKPSAT